MSRMMLILDGTQYAIHTTKLEVNGNHIELVGTLHRASDKDAPIAPKSPETGEIVSTLTASALVRLLHDGHLITAAVTHITPKAWRVYNRELGAAWLPKSILEWSSAAGQFCVTDATYVANFTTDAFSTDWPSAFESAFLIEQCYTNPKE